MMRRLTRQTKQEQRLVAELMQIRRQKDVIRENRLFREQQYQQRREKDIQEALDREAVRWNLSSHCRVGKKFFVVCMETTKSGI